MGNRISDAESMGTLRPAEVAAALNISRQTTYTLLRRGGIPGVRVGKQWRVPRSAVARLLQPEKEAER